MVIPDIVIFNKSIFNTVAIAIMIKIITILLALVLPQRHIM